MMMRSTSLKLKSLIVNDEEEENDVAEDHDCPFRRVIPCLMNENTLYYERLHSLRRE